MILEHRNAVVFGAGGAIGGAVAKAFAREGARVFLSGRSAGPVERVAREIAAKGGDVETAVVDVFDEAAVDAWLERVAAGAGAIDVMINAIGFRPVQGVALTDIAREDFASPIATWTTAQFLTARSAARHMKRSGSGVILTLSASPARLAIGMTGGFGVACAAIEGLTRTLAAELGSSGIRVVCLRPHRIGETLVEADFPMPRDEFVGFLENMTLTRRLPTLDEVGGTAAFLASHHAASMSGVVANLTGGMSVD